MTLYNEEEEVNDIKLLIKTKYEKSLHMRYVNCRVSHPVHNYSVMEQGAALLHSK